VGHQENDGGPFGSHSMALCASPRSVMRASALEEVSSCRGRTGQQSRAQGLASEFTKGGALRVSLSATPPLPRHQQRRKDPQKRHKEGAFCMNLTKVDVRPEKAHNEWPRAAATASPK